MQLVVSDGVVVKYILICDTAGMNCLQVIKDSFKMPVICVQTARTQLLLQAELASIFLVSC